MTSLVAWVGVDSRGPASLYLTSGSRISWGDRGSWSFGRKLFASNKHPEIVGYVGDVLFPSLVLGQIIDLIDNNTLFRPNDVPEEKLRKLIEILQRSFEQYPIHTRGKILLSYTVQDHSKG